MNLFDYINRMKFLTIPFLIFSTICWGQGIFTSPLTQHRPSLSTTEFEEVNRKISFDSDTITIVTETVEGKEIETFYIQEKRMLDETLTYFCLTRDKRKVTIAVPYQEEIEIIDLYKKNSETGEDMHIRFHIN